MGSIISAASVIRVNTSRNNNRKQQHRRIESRQKQLTKQKDAVIKILLLGAGDSGKSTILKQMKIMHQDGFSNEEVTLYARLCRKNLLQTVHSIVHMYTKYNMEFSDERTSECTELLASSTFAKSGENCATQKELEAIEQLWGDSSVKHALSTTTKLKFLDSAPYLLNRAREILAPTFVPTNQDILRTRLPTTGIIQTHFTVNGTPIQIYDVGGQRGERKQWIYCFNDVTALMFIASLSEYDNVLEEDRTKNRMDESLDLFEGIVNLPWFRTCSTILFLNKVDLFHVKIKNVKFSGFFNAYHGDDTAEDVIRFIREMFMDRNDYPGKHIFIHVTNATDTTNIRFVWSSVQRMILEDRMLQIGLQ
jgi:guanine nucleotide-binding protein G(o) subunit alpha